jgi:hypothetical protein
MTNSNYKLYLGDKLICPPCPQDSDSDTPACEYIECGGTMLYSDCGMIQDPGYFYYLDCGKCECVKMSLFNLWDAIEWQANRLLCNSAYKIDNSPCYTIDKKSITYNQYFLYITNIV